MSELAIRLIAENKRTKAKTLDLGNCGLSEIPVEVGELVWLESLHFSDRWYDPGLGRFRQCSNEGPANQPLTGKRVLQRLGGLRRLTLKARGDIFLERSTKLYCAIFGARGRVNDASLMEGYAGTGQRRRFGEKRRGVQAAVGVDCG